MAACINVNFDKIEELPSLEDDFEYFRVRSDEKEIKVKASSSFEAAVKMAFALREFGQLDTSVAIIVVVSANGDEFKYNAIKADPVAVELQEKIVKAAENKVDSVSTNDRPVDIASTNTSERLGFSNSSLIHTTLRNYFGFASFISLQEETIVSTMAGNNVLTVVGTGGGKTLTYLLPAVLSSNPTLVISPIKSLIDDTLVRCLNLNILSCKFTGDVPHGVKEVQLQNMESFKIIFATPECLETGESLRVKIDELIVVGKLERIVFDEAHVISSWGNTFRPSYKDVCKHLCNSKCPKLLLSATVPLKVENDLRGICGDFTVLRRTVYRDNLYLEVIERTGKFLDQLSEFILQNELKGASGIVYCVLPHDVSKIHGELLKRGINAVKYHGKLSDAVKLSSQSKWMSGEVKVIVANSSFGMGIDKPNVRYVVHAKLPTSIEEYFQQCGRAGRDGLPSHCKLFYNYSDKNILYRLFDEQVIAQYKAVNDLIVLLENPVQCLHQGVLSYFGEKHDSFICLTGCSNCKHRGTHQITDGTSDALKVLQAVVELSNISLTCNDLKLYLAGSNQKCVSHLQEYATFGTLEKKFVPVPLLAKFLHLLIVGDILTERVNKRGTGSSISIEIALGPNAHELLANNIMIDKYEKT